MAIAIVMGVSIALLCIISGPGTFDGQDGPEFAVAGQRMEIPHSPGYPLFLDASIEFRATEVKYTSWGGPWGCPPATLLPPLFAPFLCHSRPPSVIPTQAGNPVNNLSSLRVQRGNLNRLVSWSGCVLKGVQREFPLVRVWGYPPATKSDLGCQ